MPFLLLLVLTLTCLQRDWPAPLAALGVGGGLLLTWGTVALMTTVAWVAARLLSKQLRNDPSVRTLVQRRLSRFRRWHFYVLMVLYFGMLLGGWGWFVTDCLIYRGIAFPGIDVVLLSPLLVAMVLAWAVYHPVERTLAETSPLPAAEPFPGRWVYVGLQARTSFLLVAPPLVLMFVQQLVLALWPGLQDNALVVPMLGVVLLASMYIGIPWLLRLLLNLHPLPEGSLRDRLLATARRLNFRCNDILVWNTRHTIVNALVTGPLPWLRYVVLTDRLVIELAPEEVEAVFGHEVGHIKHHHLLFYFGFLMASLLAVIGVWSAVTNWLNQPAIDDWVAARAPLLKSWLEGSELLSALPLLAFLGGYIFVVFGFLSRRCERQADIYGCRTVSVPVFVEALEKVARLNGISRDRPGWLMSWQHSTIAKRVAFLEQMHADPALEPAFQRRIGWVKWGIVVTLAAVLAAMTAIGPDNLWEVVVKAGN
jgi:Zn-dependent protease with chaperone function